MPRLRRAGSDSPFPGNGYTLRPPPITAHQAQPSPRLHWQSATASALPSHGRVETGRPDGNRCAVKSERAAALDQQAFSGHSCIAIAP